MKVVKLRHIPKILTIKAQKEKEPEMVIRPREKPLESELPEEYQLLAQRIGEGNARIVMRMEQQGVTADSSAEYIAYYWLEMQQIPFSFQVPVMGGRVAEGSVVDFVLYNMADGCLAWRIQGEYWHREEATGGRDKAQKNMMIGADANGYPIRRVVDIAADNVYDQGFRVFEDAAQGIEWPTR